MRVPRPSAPCKADLYYRGALKRHSEAHPVAPVGYMWMPSRQMPSHQIESMGEFIGDWFVLGEMIRSICSSLRCDSRQ